ncbi:YjbE family putative metal transport protein [Falsiroseomonas selenitidurans]|uniref:YjbE family putative metal transport protein n=1 Tax=Falsiroseomonas selenitidurans TaxID=2716335 RepID=A0ABX1E0U8_9PROT|nr:YjbE family putative metal transport protein [Falsiroseomonas selenitidurans]NKC30681.1 YjbE family putative metal transport protein [Falsiroseomonas selenitidurans]
MDSLYAQAPQFLEILWLNIILSGDNAVVIGLAAAGLPPHLRGKAVLFGILTAAALRIVFSLGATWLLGLWWVELIGGLALLYIAWGFWKELRHEAAEAESGAEPAEKTLVQALRQIIIADVSMSLDNVLAVAAVARNNVVMLVIGLTVSILLMGLLGGALARLLDRYKLIAYVGLALIAYIGVELLWEGAAAANETLALGLPLPVPHAATPH